MSYTSFHAARTAGLLIAFFLIGCLGVMLLKASPRNDFSDRSSSSSTQISYSTPISFRTAFENSLYTPGHRTGYFYAGIEADQVTESATTRVPFNLALVIDRSGSMAGDKLYYVKEAARRLIDDLGPDDYLSLIVYDDVVDVLQAASPVRNKTLLRNKINAIFERGNTNLCGGALEGYRQVSRVYNPHALNRVLLLSDGLANRGITQTGLISAQVEEQLHRQHISISTFGVGLDYNEDLMTRMAERGNGNYYFISRPADIPELISNELNGMQQQVVHNLQVRFRIPDAMHVDEVIGASYTRNGMWLECRLPDLGSGAQAGVLLHYHLSSGNKEAFTIQSELRFEKEHSYNEHLIGTSNILAFTQNESRYEDNWNTWVSEQVALMESSRHMEEAMQEADQGHYYKAKELIRENDVYMRSRPEAVRAAPAMQKAANLNLKYEETLGDVATKPEAEKKYIQKEAKQENYLLRNRK